MGRIADIASGRTSVGGGRLSGVVSSESAVNEKNKYYLDVEKKNRYAEAIKKAEKAQEEAQKASENLKFWEGIAGIPKQIYQAGKETGAAILDTAERTSLIEPIRNAASGISNVVTGPSNVPASLKFEQGVQESKGRKTLFEKVSGKELTNQDGTINWDAGRQFIGRAAEAPTYVYAGAVKGAELVGKGLLSRILTRTVKSTPEAAVNTGIQQFEQGNTENVGTNFLANALLLSGISNIAGEVRFSKDVAKKTIDDIESELGKLSLSEKADVIESLQQGVKPGDIVENVRKVKNDEVKPEELASKINEQAGVKESTPEIPEQKQAESVQRYMAFNEKFTPEQAAAFKKKPVGVDSLEFDKDGNITLYRDGDIKPGEPQSYSLVQTKGQVPVVVNKKDILVNFNSDEITSLMEKASDNLLQKQANLEALEKYQNLETEVIAISKGQGEKSIDTSLPEQPKPDVTPKKESGYAKSLEEKAVEKKMASEFQDLAEYTPAVRKEQAQMTTKLINEDIEKVKSILDGKSELPSGMRGSSLALAVEQHAMANGDVKLLHKLAKSKISTGISEAGSELSMLVGRNANSPVRIIRNIIKARKENVTKRLKGKKVSEARKQTKESIKKAIKKEAPTKETWSNFIKEIKC